MTYDLDKVIIALDTPDVKKAVSIVRLLKDKVSVFKVGLELFCSAGPSIVKQIADEGCQVFLDLKFHDIPNTAAGAAAAAINTGAFMFNVHASGGRQMMEKVRERVDSIALEKKPIVLAVTVLTSLEQEDLKQLNIGNSVMDQVVSLAVMAKEAGLDGVVASPKEIAAIREALGRDFVIVTPGVRPAWADTGDQKRITTPAQALESGADYIVVGRPVTAALDPVDALDRLFD